MMHCGFYVSSRTGSCIPLPDKSSLVLASDLSPYRKGQEVVFLCLRHVDLHCDVERVGLPLLRKAWKLVSRASVKGLLLSSGTFVHGSISEDRGLDSPPASPDDNPVEDIEQAIASEWTRVEDTYGLERPPAWRKPGLHPSPNYSTSGRFP